MTLLLGTALALGLFYHRLYQMRASPNQRLSSQLVAGDRVQFWVLPICLWPDYPRQSLSSLQVLTCDGENGSRLKVLRIHDSFVF